MSRRSTYREVILVPRSSTYFFVLECLENPLAAIAGLLLIGGIWILSSGKLFSPPAPVYTKVPQAQKFLVKCQEAMKMEQTNLAIDYCTRAIKIDPNFSEAYSLRGEVYSFLTNPGERLKNYEKALSLFQAQGYHQEAENMKKLIYGHKYIINLRKENAQSKN